MANLLWLILGLQVGFWSQKVYFMLVELKERLQAKREYTEAGIVRPTVQRVQQVQRIDLTSPTGGVRRPTPDEYLLANMKEQNERLKNLR